MEKRKKKGVYRIRPEIVILILIIGCVLFVMNYEYSSRMKGMLILDENGMLSICHEGHNRKEENHRDERILWEFEANTCRFIEVLDTNLEVVFRMTYADIPTDTETQKPYKPIIMPDEKLDLIQMRTEKTKDGDTADIYYMWTRYPNGDIYLIAQSVSHNAVRQLKIFNAVCYLMIILCVALMTIMIYWQCMSIVSRYQRIKKEMEETSLLD